MDAAVLDQEMYSEAEAARLLGVAASTLHYWLDGGTYGGKTYKPVIRIEPTGLRVVSWAEFVEASLLREYRRRRVPMAELRAFVDLLRERYGVPYPLADRRPLIAGRDLVLEFQETAHLDAEFCLVAVVKGQPILTPPSQSFLERVTWDGDLAAGWRPAAEQESTVIVRPDMRFGKPNVKGISTEALIEHSDAGESEDEIAETFGLDVADVRWALSYEQAARNRAA